MSENLKNLLARIEGAAGADRRLDYEIFSAFAVPGEANPWDPKEGHFYTASVDAALGLLDRVLPGWGGRVSFGPTCRARLWHLQYSDKTPISHDAPAPALAILGSLLTALLASSPEVTRQGEKP